ncbi:MAG: hypothetical protein Q7S69_03240 [Nitrosomonadaceae bacterium]|nr:hypothetical protein [Nitrosomonadaceae bacterium]
MKYQHFADSQRGVTLIVGLIMLVMVTLLVISAFTLSGGNLKAAGNMQFRNEAIAAANIAIEQTISGPFSTINSADSINIDIDQDNTIDYVVDVAVPVCIQAPPASADTAALSGVNSNISNMGNYLVLWEITATATSQATGASAVVKQGVSQRLTQSQYNASTCPNP